MLEKQIERKLKEAVKKYDGLCLKQNGMAGIPDRLVLLPDGKMAFVELKAPGERPRPLQFMRHKQLRRLGYRVYVIDEISEIEDVIAEIGGDGHEVYTT